MVIPELPLLWAKTGHGATVGEHAADPYQSGGMQPRGGEQLSASQRMGGLASSTAAVSSGRRAGRGRPYGSAATIARLRTAAWSCVSGTVPSASLCVKSLMKRRQTESGPSSEDCVHAMRDAWRDTTRRTHLGAAGDILLSPLSSIARATSRAGPG